MLKMAAFNKVKIGQWEPTKYPKGSNLHFHSTVEGKLEEIQQAILKNLWNSKSSHDKIRNLNILAFYFSNLPKQGFSYFVVVQGKIPGIYSIWTLVIEQIHDFQKPLWKGFRNIHEALDFARQNIGIDFFIDHTCKIDSQRVVAPQRIDIPNSS